MTSPIPRQASAWVQARCERTARPRTCDFLPPLPLKPPLISCFSLSQLPSL